MHKLLLLFLICSVSSVISEFYLSYPKRANWYQARRACNSRGMNLVSVKSSQKSAKILKYINSNNSITNFYVNTNGIWTSGADLEIEGDWIWMTAGNKFLFESWDKEEPNGGYTESCMAMHIVNDAKLVWNDARCGEHELFYMCEYKILELQDSITTVQTL